MRRGINIRKRKKFLFNELNKKSLKLITLLISIILVCIFTYILLAQNVLMKVNLEKDSLSFSYLNENIPFSFKKIVLFSSATAETDSANQLLSLDISQYCDIGIYLNKLENTNISISSLYIDNIVINSPEIGSPYLYKKSIADFGKCSFEENNIINNNFYFNIIDGDKSINYNNYEAYSDSSTPIALGFYNKNIKTEFITEKTEILYNGALLKEAKIPLSSLNCSISFTINVTTNSNEHYICNVNFDIPLQDENSSIYNTGYLTKEIYSNQTNKFIRVK